MEIIFSPKCLEYGNNHIESGKRIERAKDVLKYQFLEPEPADEEIILQVHGRQYLNSLKRGEIEDADTLAYPDIYNYARLSAGGALLAAEKQGFSLMRPPGHHAGINGPALGAPTRGFCYLNNLAIAVFHLDKRTLILDIDGHHGNGTEEIFRGNKKVTFISLHGDSFYPGTGKNSYQNCINVPLPADCGEEVYLQELKKALSEVDLKEIEVIAVSAGFDSHAGDLASLGLDAESFFKIGEIIGKLDKHSFFVLEGGYIGENVGRDIDLLIKGLLGYF